MFLTLLISTIHSACTAECVLMCAHLMHSHGMNTEHSQAPIGKICSWELRTFELAVVRKLHRKVKISAINQRDDLLQIVTALAGDPEFISLNLGLDCLRPFVAN